MTPKLKNYLHFGVFLFCIALCIISCQKDDDLKEHLNSQVKTDKLNIKRVKENDFLTNKALAKKLKQIETRTESIKNSKMVYDSIHNFTVNTDEANFIELDNVHSYSFPIYRAYETNTLENLLLVSNSDNSYDTYIVDYNLTIEEFESIPLNSATSSIAEFYPINFDLGALANKDTACQCNLYTEYQTHYNEGDDCECGTSYTYSVLVIDCSGCDGGSTDGGDSSGSDSSGPSNDSSSNTSSGPGSGAGSGSSGSSSTPIAPIAPCREPDCIPDLDPIHDKNCVELKKLTSSPPAGQTNPFTVDGSESDPTGNNTNTRIAIINASTNNNFENGFAFYNKGDFPTYGAYAHYFPPIENQHIYFPPSAFQFGTLHTHPNDGVAIPMFSHDDLYSLLSIQGNYGSFQMQNTPNGNAVFVAMLIVNQGGATHTYAIKIEDPTKLLSLNNFKNTQTEWDDFGEELASAYEDDASGINGSAIEYQKTFLSFLGDLDIGVSLYKMKPDDPATPDELETWEKLSLNNDNITKTPCN